MRHYNTPLLFSLWPPLLAMALRLGVRLLISGLSAGPRLGVTLLGVTLLGLIVLGFTSNKLQADIVLSADSKSTKAMQMVDEAEAAVRAGELDQARQVLAKLEGEPDQFHTDIMLAELLLRNGRQSQGRAILERFTATSGPRFELFLAYAKLALQDRRWFDAFVHSQLAATYPMPESWTETFKKENQVELDRVAITSVAARGNWEHVRQLTTKYLVDSESGERIEAADERAKEIDPQILELAARAEFHLNNAREAHRIYSMLASIKAGAVNPFVEVGKLYESVNNIERAESFYSKATEAEPVDGMAVLEFARWLIWQNRPADARSELDKLKSAAEFAKERDYLLALVHRQFSEFESARELLNKLHEADSKSMAIGNQLALVLIESPSEEDQSEALLIAAENVKADRMHADVWSTLGWIQLKLGMLDQAQESLAIAANSGQVSRDTAYYLSQLKLKLGETQASEELRQQAENADGPFFYAGK